MKNKFDGPRVDLREARNKEALELKPRGQRGDFIVLYGANNLGKSVQMKILERKIKAFGGETSFVKYPVYGLEPTGPLLNDILRHRDNLSSTENIKRFARLRDIFSFEVSQNMSAEDIFNKISQYELQKIYARNRKDYEPELIETLNSGVNVLSECYVATGIAWGMKDGETLENLEKINEGLLAPDQMILLDGEKRYETGIEKGHKNEDRGEREWSEVRDIFRSLASRYKWKTIKNAGMEGGREPDNISEEVWESVDKGHIYKKEDE